MTKRDELLALAERCEKASEGSSTLDGLIAHAAGYRVGDDDSITAPNGNRADAIPGFTTSLDAAMTLVPTGHDWSLFFDNGSALAGCMPSSEDGCDLTDVPGATPALALCAAALRAAVEG